MMKKILVTIFVALFTMGVSMAQDLGQATELFNNAGTTLMEGNETAALDLFRKAMDMALQLGEEGTAIVTECKTVIPQLMLKLGKDMIRDGNIDDAILKIKKAAETAAEYENEGVLLEANDLLAQLKINQLMGIANDLLTAREYAEAYEAYKDVIAVDPNNANAYFRMGQAANAADNTDAAEEAFIKAKELDESIAENVDRQLSTVYIKKAVACQRAKDLKGALENAQKSIEFGDNANAQKIVGLTALGLKQNAVAAEALKAYLAMSPDARDRVQIIYQLGTALIGAGQTGEACGYFKEIAQDPKWGEAARYQITVLKCK
jgi:tetratricopeptide (TPR) repeat protein